MTTSRIRLVRALITLAVGLPVAGLVAGLRRMPEPPPPAGVGPAGLRRTYWDWNLMSRAVWEPDRVERAVLRREEASPSEAALLTAAMRRCHRDPSRAWKDDWWRELGFPDGGRWYKLIDPTDDDRWVGVGVFKTRTICRLAIGFDPDAEQAAAPDGREER